MEGAGQTPFPHDLLALNDHLSDGQVMVGDAGQYVGYAYHQFGAGGMGDVLVPAELRHVRGVLGDGGRVVIVPHPLRIVVNDAPHIVGRVVHAWPPSCGICGVG